MTARILQGDVFDVLPTLAPGSVDCVVTSPPYFQLRDYGTGTWEGGDPACEHVKRMARQDTERLNTPGMASGNGGGNHCDTPLRYADTCGKCGARRVDKQLGLEATPEAYVEAMVRVFRLVWVAMADHAVAFVNVGDTYTSGNSGESGMAELGKRWRGGGHSDAAAKHQRPPADDLPAGNLALIPQRLALALQADGWIVRSVVVWAKPSPMPQSVAGWAWRQCRVKTKERPVDNEKSTGGRYNGAYTRAHNLAQWADCPGCPKCLPNGGLVLRRGSGRCTSSWEPILMLTKKPLYYFDNIALAEAVRGKETMHGMRPTAADGGVPSEQGVQGNGAVGQVQGLRQGVPGRAQEDGSVQANLFDLVGDDGQGQAAREEQALRQHARGERLQKEVPEDGKIQGGAKALHQFGEGQGDSKGGLREADDRPRVSGEAAGKLPALEQAKGRKGSSEALFPESQGEDDQAEEGQGVQEFSEGAGSGQSVEYQEEATQGAGALHADAEGVAGDQGSVWASVRVLRGEKATDARSRHSADEGRAPHERECGSGLRTVQREEGDENPHALPNARDVWVISSEPLSSKHYASFPTELVFRCLAAGTSQRGYCPQCGAPWARVVEQGNLIKTGTSGNTRPCYGGKHDGRRESAGKANATHTPGMSYENKTLGWRPTCPHGDLPPRPGLVLDPFAGSGRVGIQCQRMGMDFVGVELSEAYCALARRLLADTMPLFADSAPEGG